MKTKMTKMSKIVFSFMLICVVFASVFNIKAATSTTTININGTDVEFTYEIKGNYIQYFACSNPEKIVGKFEMPDEIEGKKIISIKDSGFKGAKNMTECILPEYLESLGVSAFANCTTLTTVTINKNLLTTTSWQPTFENCSKLTTIILPEGLTTIPAHVFEKLPIASITLPSTLETIGDSAFSGCTNLKEIVFPDSLKTIGSGAFSGCTNLKDIVFSNSLKTIGSSAFENCKELTKITLPDSVKTIDSEAFAGCDALYEVDLGKVETINYSAFLNCTALEEITIPKTVVKSSISAFGYAPFSGCTRLKKITLEEGMTKIAGGLLANTVITEITIPSTIVTIGDSAFSGNKEITKITLPDSVKTIESDAFAGCDALYEVDLGKVETINYSAFENCTALEEITIPKTVVKSSISAFGYAPFSGCTRLKKITLEEGMTKIPEGLLANTVITEITIPNTVVTIGDSAFENNKEIIKITLPDSVKTIEYDAFAGCNALYEVDLGNVTTINHGAFRNCTALEEITIPKTVVTSTYSYSGDSAFSGCTRLKKITLEEGMTKIPEGLLANTPITEITIPSTVVTIEDSAFWGCTVLEEIVLPDSVKTIASEAFAYCYALNKVDLGNVTTINYSAFLNCTALEEITIPKTVVTSTYSYSGYSPFSGCTRLKKITLEEGMTKIPEGLLANTPITEITIPSTVVTIGESAFWGCTVLEEIVLPDSVKTIASEAFAYCYALNKVDLGSVETINHSAFLNCTALEEITIPKTVVTSTYSYSGDSAFSGCTRLKKITLEEGMTKIPTGLLANTVIEEITIPSTVVTIEDDAFNNCKQLSELTLSKKISSIGSYAFEGCTKLTKLTVLGDPKLGNNILLNHSAELVIYCYEGSTLDKYAKDNSIECSYLEPKNFEIAQCSKIEDQIFTGKEIKPAVEITYNGEKLTQGLDYTLTYSNNINAGQATLVITGRVEYKGSIEVKYNILKDISKTQISGISKKVYTGKDILQDVVIKDNNVVIENGQAYEIEYKNNKNVGTATMIITGKGYYYGTIEKTFVIDPKAVYELDFAEVESQVYTGKAIEPSALITYDELKLVNNEDYTTTYKNNTNVGTATITVTGKGNYTGTKSITFKIVPKDITTLTFEEIADTEYIVSTIKPKPVVKMGSTTLIEGTDYKLAYSNNTNVGTATITITGMNNYTGTKIVTFNIVGKDIATLTVGEISDKTYTGETITPKLESTITYNGKKLVEGTDYTLTYSNNVNVGIATITITGKGNYAGTKTVTFNIVEPEETVDISTATVNAIENKPYTGNSITPKPVVKVGSVTLVEGTDYTLTYSNNVNVGTATITITGKGNYKGTKKVTFKIYGDISLAEVSKVGTQTYTGYEIYPNTTLILNGKTLKEGTDYDRVTTNNVNLGIGTITITGKGNYIGTKVVTFEIVARDIADLIVSEIMPLVYTGNAITPDVIIRDEGYATLLEGTDYTLTYSNNVNIGTATITITGKGNYTGTKEVEFKICGYIPDTIVNAIDTQTYTGNSITPKPIVKVGSTTLVEGTDYTLTYSNNVNVGTATITITGKGNYTGTKVVTFKIVKAETENYGYLNFSLDKTVSYDKDTVTVKIIAAKPITDYEMVLTLDNIPENITVVNKLAGSNAKIKDNTVTMYMIQPTSQEDKTVYPAGTVLAEITYKIPDGYFELNKGFDGTATVVNTCAIRITDNGVNYEYSLTENVTIKEINIHEVLQETLKEITVENNSVEYVKASLEQATGLTVVIKDKDGNTLDTTDKMGTGTTVAIVDENGNTISTQTVSIHGEINGDGEVNFFDIITMISLIYDEEDYVWEEAFRSAAKFGAEGEPNFFDIMSLIQHIYE